MVLLLALTTFVLHSRRPNHNMSSTQQFRRERGEQEGIDTSMSLVMLIPGH
jgi:hypothetical protein